MRDLARADYSTVKTFITNNVSAERLLADVLNSAAASLDSKFDALDESVGRLKKNAEEGNP